MMVARLATAVLGIGVAPLLIVACGSDSTNPPEPTTTAHREGDNHGERSPQPPAGTRGGHWDADGQPVNGGPVGADGSTGNKLTQEYCAQNEDPGCPVDSYVGPNAILNPDGSNTYVPYEGTICTDPDHGVGGPAATEEAPSGDEPPVAGAPADDGGDP